MSNPETDDTTTKEKIIITLVVAGFLVVYGVINNAIGYYQGSHTYTEPAHGTLSTGSVYSVSMEFYNDGKLKGFSCD